MNRGFSDEEWTIFVDEKRFEATSNGVYNLPSEDLTPTRRVQSKSNPVFVMVLLAIAAPRGEWNGIIGSHYFVERVAAAKKSKNRDAGTMEMHPLNVTKESYVMAWIGSIIPAIAKAIEDGNLPKPSANRPFLLQGQCQATSRPVQGRNDCYGVHLQGCKKVQCVFGTARSGAASSIS